MKKPVRNAETVLCVAAAVIGDWTTAVSRKDRKNRGRRDDSFRHERTTSLSDGPSHKTEISNYSPSPGSNKSKTKVCAKCAVA